MCGGGIYIAAGGVISTEDSANGIDFVDNTAPDGAAVYIEEHIGAVLRNGNVYIENGAFSLPNGSGVKFNELPRENSLPVLHEAINIAPANATIYIGFELVGETQNDEDEIYYPGEGNHLTLMRAENYDGTLIHIRGGGVYYFAGLTIDGGGQNRATTTGNLICIDGEETMCGCGLALGLTLQNNAKSAVYISKGELALLPNSLIRNCSDIMGGGVYAERDSKICLYGGTIQDSTATNGGGIYTSGILVFEPYTEEIFGEGLTTTFTGNAASENGGGIYIAAGGLFTSVPNREDPTITGGVDFIGNSAVNGEGMYMHGTVVVLAKHDGDVYLEEGTVVIGNESGVVINAVSSDNSLPVLNIAAKLADVGATIYVSCELVYDCNAKFLDAKKNLTIMRASGYNGTLIHIRGGEAEFKHFTIDGGGSSLTGITGNLIRVSSSFDEGEGQYYRGELVIDGATLQNNAESAIRVGGDEFYSVTDEVDGEHYVVSPGRVTMNSGTIQNCRSASNGGAVRVESGGFGMYGGIITGCSAVNGGGVYAGYYVDEPEGCFSSSDVGILGGTIEGCHATNNGGAAYVVGSGKIRQEEDEDGYVETLTCKSRMVIMHQESYSNTPCIVGVPNSPNTAINGGGVYVGAYGELDYGMISDEFYGVQYNHATNNGGGIYIANDGLFLNNTYVYNAAALAQYYTIRGNSAEHYGGGLYAESGAELYDHVNTLQSRYVRFEELDTKTDILPIISAKGMNFIDNSAGMEGAGFYLAGGKHVLFNENGEFACEGAYSCDNVANIHIASGDEGDEAIKQFSAAWIEEFFENVVNMVPPEDMPEEEIERYLTNFVIVVGAEFDISGLDLSVLLEGRNLVIVRHPDYNGALFCVKEGTTTLSNFVIDGFNKKSNTRGNLIRVEGGVLNLDGMTLRHNVEAAISVTGGTVNMTDSIIIDCPDATT